MNTVRHIVSQCAALHFSGLMTIGRSGYDLSQAQNPDFQVIDRIWLNFDSKIAYYN